MSVSLVFAMVACTVICVSCFMIAVATFWDTFYPIWYYRNTGNDVESEDEESDVEDENIVDSVND